MPPVQPEEYAYARYRMVERQLGARDIRDERVLEAMASVPRELFVPEELRDRAYAALRNPNAGEVLVSAGPGFEFADLGGRHHAGGGSHGSLGAGDSLVPMLTVGLERLPRSIVEIAPAVLEHFGIEPPRYASARNVLAA